MRKIEFALSISLFLACGTILQGYASHPVVTPTTPIVIKLPPKTPIGMGHRPKMPTRQEIICTYADGSLYFDFAFPEGECELTLYNLATGETATATFDSELGDAVYVGYHSTAEITLTTDLGNTYSGSW